MSQLWLKIKEKLVLLRNKKKYVAAFVIVVGGLGYWAYNKQTQAKAAAPRYVVATAEKGTVVASLSGTGQVVALNKVELKPSGSGVITQVKTKINTHVKAGDVLVILDQRSAASSVAQARASVASAQANYQKLVAGLSPLEKATYEPQIASAEADYLKAQTDASSSIKSAELSLQAAQNNLNQATGGDSSQVVMSVYEDTVDLLQGLLPKFNDLLNQADNILGLDNTAANADFKQYLGLLNQTYLNQAYSNYTYAKVQIAESRGLIEKLNGKSNQADIDVALNSSQDSIVKLNALLTSISDTLNNTYPLGSLTNSVLDSKKGSISSARSSAISSGASITNQKQAIVTAKNSLSNYQIDYDKAVQNLAQAKANAESSIRNKELSLKQIQNNFALKNEPASAADLAVAKAQISNALAQLQSAETQYQNNIIKAPFEGDVVALTAQVGDQVGSGTTIGTLITNQKVAQISLNEVDVAKIKLDQKVNLTFDAVDGLNISGHISLIDALGTVTQGVVNYTVQISFDTQDERIKPGMSVRAAIIFDAKTDVVVVPNSAVKSFGTQSYVEVVEQPGLDPAQISASGITLATAPRQQLVEVGLANDSMTEIVSGLKEGEMVVTQTITPTAANKTAAANTSAFRLPTGGATGGGGIRTR